jgi:hypothetical protein
MVVDPDYITSPLHVPQSKHVSSVYEYATSRVISDIDHPVSSLPQFTSNPLHLTSKLQQQPSPSNPETSTFRPNKTTMGVSLSTARYLAPLSFAYDFAAQQYGLNSKPNMMDIHERNISFWSPNPYFIGAFFFPQQL